MNAQETKNFKRIYLLSSPVLLNRSPCNRAKMNKSTRFLLLNSLHIYDVETFSKQFAIVSNIYINYSKNPHKRTSGLRTPRLKFAQKDTIYIRTYSARRMKIVLIKKSPASYIRTVTYLLW